MAEQRELAVARNGVAPTELAAALYGDHGRAVRRSPRLFGFCRSRRPATHRTARDHRTRTAAPLVPLPGPPGHRPRGSVLER